MTALTEYNGGGESRGVRGAFVLAQSDGPGPSATFTEEAALGSGSSALEGDMLCECGCGEATRLAPKTMRSRGWIKGMPIRFRPGHNGRLRPSGVVAYDVDPDTGCWNWTRSRQPNGYGHLTINNRQVLAHRFVYERDRGPIPAGMTLDHLCRNPRCVNPDHLEPVSHAENCRRGKRAKLTIEEARRIRVLRRGGMLQRVLAERFGVSLRTIRSVIKEEAWV